MAGFLEHRRWRRDVAAFAAEALGLPLAGWRAEDLRAADEAVFTAWLRARQGGKARGAAGVGVDVGASRPGSLVLFLSGGGEVGSRRHLATLRWLLAGSELAGSVVDEGASVVRLVNGSVVRCVPASVASVVGWTAALVVVDESQLVARQ